MADDAHTVTSGIRGYLSENVFVGKRVLVGSSAKRQRRYAIRLMEKAKLKGVVRA